jgi:hypothetical protein
MKSEVKNGGILDDLGRIYTNLHFQQKIEIQTQHVR